MCSKGSLARSLLRILLVGNDDLLQGCSTVDSIDIRELVTINNAVSTKSKAPLRFTRQDIETRELPPSQLLTFVKRRKSGRHEETVEVIYQPTFIKETPLSLSGLW